MPLITVSRMVGAGGAELAARVAASLGWQLVDNELVDSVAKRLGVPGTSRNWRTVTTMLDLLDTKA